jgi:hypothetical protein
MLARLAAALQRGQLQGVNGAQLGAALGGAGIVLNNEDCSVSVPLEGLQKPRVAIQQLTSVQVM